MNALLEIKDLTVRYGGATAVCEVSISVQEAAFVGLIGPNGVVIGSVGGRLRGTIRSALSAEPLVNEKTDRPSSHSDLLK